MECDSDTESICSTLSEASSVEGSFSSKVYVGSKLPSHISEHDIKQHFLNHNLGGPIISVTMFRKPSKVSMGCGYVTVDSEEHAQEAIRKLNGTLLHGKYKLVVHSYTRRRRHKQRSTGSRSPSGANTQSSTKKKSSSAPASKGRSRLSSSCSSQGELMPENASFQGVCKVSVGSNLPSYIVVHHLREHFKEFKSDIRDIRIIQDSSTKPSKGIGIITFSSQASAERAIKTKNGTRLLDKHELQVKRYLEDWQCQPSPPSKDHSSPGRAHVDSKTSSDCPPAKMFPSPLKTTPHSGSTIQIQNLHTQVSEQEIVTILAVPVINCHFEPAESSSSGTNTASVTLCNPLDVPKAIASVDGKTLLGCTISACIVPATTVSTDQLPEHQPDDGISSLTSHSSVFRSEPTESCAESVSSPKEVPSDTIKVCNIPCNIKQNAIRRSFKTCGTITSIKIVSNANPAYAFVAFTSSAEAQAAFKAKHNTYLGKSKVTITVCHVRKLEPHHQGSDLPTPHRRTVDSAAEVSPSSAMYPLDSSTPIVVESPPPSARGKEKGDKALAGVGAKATVVCFSTTDCSIRKQTFLDYLSHRLGKCAGKFSIVEVKRHDNGTEFKVQFSSTNTAKRALAVLNKVPGDFTISLEGFNTKPLLAEIIDFQASVLRKKTQYITKHRLRLDKLEVQLKAAQIPKNCPFHLFDKLLQQKTAVQQQVTESREQEAEFVEYCRSLEQELQHLKSSASATRKPLKEKISTMRKDFGRECNSFRKALPIYAKRREIVEAVSTNQVTILIGETGSGKSTQIVQYLYDAGFSEKGVIVCTQPRKVAAVSLAKYVSTEMDVKIGTTLGYKLGISGKHCPQTKVLYTTDHALLNECIADREFTKYSCLIVDEAHERSLHTDLLLAFIKQVLPRRADLRVVVTSATIDPKLFRLYFGEHCPILRVPGRTFPVDIIWNAHIKTGVAVPESLAQDAPKANEYVTNAMNVAKGIDKGEKPGDILVFLTSPVEIERACQSISQELPTDTTVVLPLHGKLQPEDQQKVFHEYEGKRKIIISTNVAETSVTIPGVKYIVDTGLAKELCFDPKRGMNSLEVRVISRSSAEQRKGRAGRTSAGKCYRLYSEDQYERMPERTLPELLRVHLAHACLKLYEFGISDILAFDFVEHPDPLALKAAVETLQFLGAVSEDKLTEVGKNMAALPLDPHLAKVLLDGIKGEIGPEAAAVVAISSLAGNVFFRGGTEEMKREGDRKKIQFCHPAGDQISNLSVYHTWVQQRRDQRTQWCVDNYVNAKSMRLVEETLKELRDILSRKLGIVLPARAISMESAEDTLPKLFFYSFLRNVSVFSGHERVGFMTESMPGDPLVLFPGSALNQLNLAPQLQCVVYEKTLKTSQNFLLQVTPVKEEWIQQALAAGQLSIHPAEKFHEHFVTPVTVKKVGQYVLRTTFNRKTLPEINEELKSVCQDTPHSVDLEDREKGIVKVFCQHHYHSIVKHVLEGKLDLLRTSLKKVQYEDGVTKQDDNVRMVLGLGGCIQHILMPYQYRKVVVKGPQDAGWTDELLLSLSKFGDIERSNTKIFSKQGECRLFVTFQNPGHASEAVMTLEPPEGIVIEPQSQFRAGEMYSNFQLRIEWCRRVRKTFAFVKFSREEDFQVARGTLLGSSLFVAGSQVKFPPPKEDNMQLFVINVGLQVSEEDLKAAVEAEVPGVEVQVQLGYEKQFETTPEQTAAMKQQLETLIDRHATRGRYQLDFRQPETYYKTYRASVKFQDPDEGQNTLKGLTFEEIGDKPLTVKPSLFSSNRYTPRVYKAIEDSVKALVPYLQDHFGDAVKLKEKLDKGGNTIIQVSSDNVKAFVAAKNILNAAVQPDVLECHTTVLRQFLLSHHCQCELNEIQSTTATYIYADRRSMSLSIYGTQANQTRAKIVLNGKLGVLADGDTKVHEFNLKASGRPPGLMKHLVCRFGLDLQGMLGEGVSAAELDARRQILTVYATPEAHKSIIEVIEEYSANTPTPHGTNVDLGVMDCCVCFMTIDNPKDVIRLEYCGHIYCLECIQLQVSPNAVTFPVQCATEDCSHPFIWQDFENLFQRTTFELRHLKAESLKAYLKANKRTVRNCPTPDCEMVYAVTEDGKRFVCSLCGVHLCTKCHEQYHDGLSCEMYQAGKHGEKEFEEWLQKDPANRKRCPKCTAPIEKIAGCNKMCCTHCHTFLCWVCLAQFDTEQKCYAHLQTTHGTFV